MLKFTNSEKKFFIIHGSYNFLKTKREFYWFTTNIRLCFSRRIQQVSLGLNNYFWWLGIANMWREEIVVNSRYQKSNYAKPKLALNTQLQDY